jgi:hypothetical protein
MVEVPRQDPEPNQVLLVYVKLQVGLLHYSNFYVHAEHYQVLSHLFFAPRFNSAKNFSFGLVLLCITDYLQLLNCDTKVYPMSSQYVEVC